MEELSLTSELSASERDLRGGDVICRDERRELLSRVAEELGQLCELLLLSNLAHHV